MQLLEDFGFLESKPVYMPMKPRITLSATDGEVLEDVTHYMHLVGRLLYLTITRPDITFVVHASSQFLQTPRDVHLQVVRHLLRYIKGQSGLGLHYPSSSTTNLRAFSDADWGTCTDTRRSITGYCVFLGDALIA